MVKRKETDYDKVMAVPSPATPVCRVCDGKEWLEVDGGSVACPVCVPRPPPMRRPFWAPWRKVPVIQHEEAKPNKVLNRVKDKALWMRSPKKFLVEMTFSNKNVGYLVVKPQDRIWQYQGETYIIVESMAKWCGTAKKALLRYVEGYAMPYETDADAVKMRDAAAAKAPDIKASFEPSVLREVLRFEYVKAMLRSQAAMIFVFILIAVLLNVVLSVALLYYGGKYGKWW